MTTEATPGTFHGESGDHRAYVATRPAPAAPLGLAVLLALGCSPASDAASTANSSTAVDAEMIAAEAPRDSWPGWRGWSRQGEVHGDGYPLEWSALPGEERNIAWKVPVPGSGNSSPVVWDGKIFLTTAYEGGDRRSVLAYSTEDGRLLWETFAPAGPDAESAYPKNGHASSTVATDGERVYAYLGNLGLLALTLEGEIAWHVPLGPFDAFHGTASSPLLWRDRLILVQDQKGDGNSFIAAFDRATGKQLWRTAREAQVGWNSPVPVRVETESGTRDEIVMSGQQMVIAYDPTSGEELWRASGSTFEVIPTPVVSKDLVFASSGRAGPTLAIRPGGSGDVTGSRVVWSSPKGSPFVVAPMAVGDYLYLVNDMASVLTVYEAASGDLAWQTRLGEAKRESFSAAPVAVQGHVLFTNDDGVTFVIRQGPDFEVVRTNELDEAVIASPAGVDGTWYFRTRQSLLAIRGE
ncbi:MAG: hypothetical protein DWQ36_22705 [Acidobacteria bacterium]|nr:MAG: hypothetical protein DWQ30_01770 [Acidobacteriota bacterium]REK00501.1 MAG: hypothetical protein DWQ36_22705 [Acidobacteriota bacterium]